MDNFMKCNVNCSVVQLCYTYQSWQQLAGGEKNGNIFVDLLLLCLRQAQIIGAADLSNILTQQEYITMMHCHGTA